MALHNIKQFHDFTVETVDGVLGTIKEVLFDDVEWVLRYFVIETGEWFSNSEILIPPMSVLRDDWEKGTVYVNLTQEQISDSPRIDVTRPVLRAQEAEFLDHYGYSHYWTGPSVADKAALPTSANEKQVAEEAQSRLHSTQEVLGSAVRIIGDTDGGHVEDLRFDDDRWSIEWLVVDPRNWSPGRNVLVSPMRVDRVDWEEGQVVLGMTRDELESCPKY